MDLTAAGTILTLSNSHQEWAFEGKKTKLAQSCLLLSQFGVVYKEEESKLPFQLNLLDDLKINENAHSKFLIRILEYKPALIHFLQFLNDKTAFDFDIGKIKNPFLTAEKMRMDGLIREQNQYAIIIENKIHGASEQKHQIARYIDKCINVGFQKNQIYVIYLTLHKDDEPTEQTWRNFKPEDFHTRYIQISYRTEILTWLEKHIATLPPKEELFKSALIQYSDHIKSLVNIKKDREKMNHELRNFLSRELGLVENQTENIRILQEKVTEINELSNQMNQLLQTSTKELFIGWENELKSQFKLETFEQTNDNFFKTGVKIHYQGKPFSVLIEHNLKTQAIYYGMGRHHASDLLDTDIMEFLSTLKKEESFIEYPFWWYGKKGTSFKYGYKDLESLIKLVMKQLTEPVIQNNVVSSNQ